MKNLEIVPGYPLAQYRRERKLIDAEKQWRTAAMLENGPRANFTTAEQEKRKPRRLRAVDNDMRGRVEQHEILRDLPDKFCAYLQNGLPDGRGSSLPVTVWTGQEIGRATVYTVGARRGRFGDCQRYGRARIGGKLYAWQGPGAGMYAIFRAIKGS